MLQCNIVHVTLLYLLLMFKSLLSCTNSHSNYSVYAFLVVIFLCVFSRSHVKGIKCCDSLLAVTVLCWLMLLFWLDWPQSRPSASWCVVLIVSRPVSSTSPPPILCLHSRSIIPFCFFLIQPSFFDPCLWVRLILFLPSVTAKLLSLVICSFLTPSPFTVVWTALTVVTPEDPVALTLILLPPLLPPLPHTTSSTTIMPVIGTEAPHYPSRPQLGSPASPPMTQASYLHHMTSTQCPNHPRPCQLKQR